MKKKVSRVGGSAQLVKQRATASKSEPVRTVLTRWGGVATATRQVRAEVYGAFAVHRAIDWCGHMTQDWMVTHVQSGAMVAWPTPSRAAARSLPRMLTAARLCFRFTDRTQMSGRTKRIGAEVVRRWAKRHGLTKQGTRFVRKSPSASEASCPTADPLRPEGKN